KILHYIERFDPILLPKDYFKLLAEDLDEGDELHLLMPKQDMTVEIEGVQVHHISYFSWMIWRDEKLFRKVMDSVNPDVLDFHSPNSRRVERLIQLNDLYYKRPYILSTHKQLMPWHNTSLILDRLKYKLFHQKVVKNAEVIVVDSPQETNIQENKHVVCIPNALYAYDYSEVQMRKEYQTVFNTLANSKPYIFMTPEDREKEVMLLVKAVNMPRQPESPSDAPLSPSLQRIALHAQLEGTLNMLLPLLPAKTKEFVDNSPHYNYNVAKNTESLKSVKLLSHKSTLETITREEAATKADTEIVELLLKVKHEIFHNTVSQRHLIELYKAFRQTDYNEDTVNVMLKRLGCYQDAARLMQLMKDYYGLTEGFMPMEPLDDKITKRIKDKLLLWQVQG
ncbi:MAG: hypothetical protein HUK08_08200, partial [Bacteroidaceae bacterium]|nr:hypothetical protein [Bacteroidaceae bacterium]